MTPEEKEIKVYEALADATQGTNRMAELQAFAEASFRLWNAINVFALMDKSGISGKQLEDALTEIEEARAEAAIREGAMHFLFGDNSETEERLINEYAEQLEVIDDGTTEESPAAE